ncbi:MAG: hypothetical protein EOM67_06225 [Spirochaetia bacterium]|nr:hypothetical protein [Spirochaetia bacterium]
MDIQMCLKKTKKLGAIILVASFFLLSTGCDGPLFQSYSQFELPAYDGDLSWSLVKGDAPWSNRYDHAVVAFDDNLWVLGGYSPGNRGNNDSYMEDVWKSPDGITWSLVTDNAPWHGRRGHAAVVFNNAIYIIGGFQVNESSGMRSYCNDVWSSTDGENWTPVLPSAPWSARMNHSVVESGGKIYLMGGLYNGVNYLDDVWESSDGSTWSEVTDATMPGGRVAFALTVDKSNNNIYLLGGSYAGAPPAAYGSSDPSVTNWENLWQFNPTRTPKWEAKGKPENYSGMRSEFSIEMLEGTLYLLAGKANSSYRFSMSDATYATHQYNPITDSWKVDSAGSGFGARYSYASVVWKKNLQEPELWVLGGLSDSGPTSDVWKAIQETE